MTDYQRGNERRSYDVQIALLIQKVDSMEGRLIESLAQHRQDYEQHRQDIERIDTNLNGNDDKEGLNGRVKSLERDRGRRQRHFWLIWGAIVMSWISYLFDSFLKLFKQ